MSNEIERRVLVRVIARDGLGEQGYTMAHEMIRRPVTFRVNLGGVEAGEDTLDGVVLIGEGANRAGELTIEPLARMIGNITLKILRTDAMLWVPVSAHRDPMVDMWRIECVPLVAWLRLCSRDDETLLRLAGVDEHGHVTP
jgi:hypothetical protein